MEQKPLGNPWPLAGTFTALSMATLIGGSLYVASAMRPEAVKPVTAYEQFKAADGSFGCEYPKGWKRQASESHATDSAARFHQGEASIQVESSLSSSLMSDLPTAPGIDEIPNVPGASEVNEAIRNAKRPPVERAHAAKAKDLGEELGEYKEGQLQSFRSKMGDARFAEFSAKGDVLGGKLHGYHATMLGPERAVSVVCQCPEPNWKMLKPAFERVIQSVGQ